MKSKEIKYFKVDGHDGNTVHEAKLTLLREIAYQLAVANEGSGAAQKAEEAANRA